MGDWRMILGWKVDFVKIETHGFFVGALFANFARGLSCDGWGIRAVGGTRAGHVGFVVVRAGRAHARRREQLAVQLVTAPNGDGPTNAYRRGSMDERPWMALVDPSARRM